MGSPPAMIGQTVGHYRIEALLGAGGMGVVYLAHDLTLDRRVAVKVLGERLLSESTARERFLREAKTASALNHPHVCTVHEVGEQDGQAFIVMEYVEGRPLSEALAKGLPPDTVVRYGIQIGDALAHAHERGIVHRDLKAQNVIVTPEGRAKVLDFGLAKRLPTEELTEQPTRSADSLTEAGQIVGTLHYLSPEVLRGRAADTRTDVWALGVLLYELATGERPFEGRTKFEVTSAILEQSPRPLPDRVPAGLRSVIGRCLAKEPGDRYQRGSEVRAALEVVQSFPNVPQPAPAARARRRGVWGAALAALAIASVGVILLRTGRGSDIDSLAVLPFENASADAEAEYLSDGIAEGVIGSAARIPRLKVIAFSSVLRYKGRALDLDRVVRELGVRAVVTGRVVQRGEALSISVELVDTKDRSRLWGEQYSQKLTDVLAIQDDISRKISEKLRGHLTGEATKGLARRPTEDPEAYQAYLKGRFYWGKFSPEGYLKSLDYYREAIAKDPRYALAHAGLADSYVSLAVEGIFPPGETMKEAEVAARKALEIDDGLGEAHTGLGSVRLGGNWDAAGGEREWRRAVELSPGHVPAHYFLSFVLRVQGRWDEAVLEMKKALELDPLSVGTNKSLGALYYWAHQYDPAIEQLEKTLEIDPNAADVRDLLADVYARKEMYAEALEEKRRSLVLSGDDEAADLLGHTGTEAGYREGLRAVARKQLELLEAARTEGYVSPMSFAQLHLLLGNTAQALAWLERAYDERSPWLAFARRDPAFDGLRSDPRFTDLLKRIERAARPEPPRS